MPPEARFARADPNPVSTDRMVIPEWDIRDHRPEEDIVGVATSLQEEGQIMPVLLSEREDGTAEIVDGVHRYLAAQRIGWPELDAMVVSADTDDVTAGIIANLSRLDLSSYDKLNVYHYLLNEAGLDYETAADKLGIQPRTARRWRQVLDGPDGLAQLVVQEDLPITAAAKLATVPDPDRALDIAQKALQRGWTAEVMREQAKNAKRELEVSEAVQEARQANGQAPEDPAPETDPGTPPDVDSPADLEDQERAQLRAEKRDAQPDPQATPQEPANNPGGVAPPSETQTPAGPPDEPDGPPCVVCGAPVAQQDATVVQWAPPIADRLGQDHSAFCADHGLAVANYLAQLVEEHTADAEPTDPSA